MKFIKLTLIISLICAQYVSTEKLTYILDERWMCNLKKSCEECLTFSHCSWCKNDNKCFSREVPDMQEYCKDDSLKQIEYGMSFDDNAKCTCAEGQVENHCTPAGSDVECSGRGRCECGRCMCDPTPDADNPTKTIIGEYCDYDNFSCDGPTCNEGPYSLSQPVEEGPTTNEEIGSDKRK